jgi:hypothetical protein
MRGRGNSAVLEALAAIGAAVTLVLLLMLAGCGSRGSSNINAVDQSTVQALAELDAATAPDGVDGDLFAMLKAELRDALLRRTSTPPSGADNAIADLVLFDAGTEEWTLEWSYRNVGDYDQSGTVNIADITPIAVHFGQTYDLATEPDCIQAVVDGSGNGAVDIADITPIAQNFGTAVAGYSVEVSLTEGAEWDEVNTVLQGAASGDERKSLEFVLDTPAERSLYRVRAYDAGQVPSVDPSNPVRFYTLDLTLELLTPAEGGDGSAEDPYIVAEAEPYELWRGGCWRGPGLCHYAAGVHRLHRRSPAHSDGGQCDGGRLLRGRAAGRVGSHRKRKAVLPGAGRLASVINALQDETEYECR